MSQEPTFPADATPDRPAPAAANDRSAPDKATPEKSAPAPSPPAALPGDVAARRWQIAGVGAAIGSAAIAAALLYANRSKR